MNCANCGDCAQSCPVDAIKFGIAMKKHQ
ncbi:MAG: 4Fe-4S binding protein [Desulfomonilaceae bacterium]